MSKWNDKTFHVLECMRELSAAENHLVQYISNKSKPEDQPKLVAILEKIRDMRKRIEESILE